MMKSSLMFILVVISAIIGIYVGGWVFFIGGITTFVEAVKSEPVNPFGIAWGLIKFFSSGLAFWFTFAFCVMISMISGSR